MNYLCILLKYLCIIVNYFCILLKYLSIIVNYFCIILNYLCIIVNYFCIILNYLCRRRSIDNYYKPVTYGTPNHWHGYHLLLPSAQQRHQLHRKIQSFFPHRCWYIKMTNRLIPIGTFDKNNTTLRSLIQHWGA